MAQAVQILSGTCPINGNALQIHYDYRWAKCHGLVKAGTAFWLVEISADGVFAMRLPVIKGTGEGSPTWTKLKGSGSYTTEQGTLADLIAEFGGVPSGVAFPSGADRTAAIAAGTVKELLNAAGMAPVYTKSTFSTGLGWSFSPSVLEARNTCFADVSGVKTSYLYKLVFTFGDVPTAVLSLEETGQLHGNTSTQNRFHFFEPSTGLMVRVPLTGGTLPTVNHSAPVLAIWNAATNGWDTVRHNFWHWASLTYYWLSQPYCLTSGQGAAFDASVGAGGAGVARSIYLYQNIETSDWRPIAWSAASFGPNYHNGNGLIWGSGGPRVFDLYRTLGRTSGGSNDAFVSSTSQEGFPASSEVEYFHPSSGLISAVWNAVNTNISGAGTFRATPGAVGTVVFATQSGTANLNATLKTTARARLDTTGVWPAGARDAYVIRSSETTTESTQIKEIPFGVDKASYSGTIIRWDFDGTWWRPVYDMIKDPDPLWGGVCTKHPFGDLNLPTGEVSDAVMSAAIAALPGATSPPSGWLTYTFSSGTVVLGRAATTKLVTGYFSPVRQFQTPYANGTLEANAQVKWTNNGAFYKFHLRASAINRTQQHLTYSDDMRNDDVVVCAGPLVAGESPSSQKFSFVGSTG
jgi:hypothetical protein